MLKLILIFRRRHHGTSGPMSVMVSPFSHLLTTAFVEAARELGLGGGDPNGEREGGGTSAEGFWYTQTTQDRGWRGGTFRDFVEPLLSSPLLTVLPFAAVERVLLEEREGGVSAAGVAVDLHGEKLVFRAEKEVVLSAGAVGTPKLLLLSGVGPREHLEQAGVPVRRHLPGVGRNLQDHLFALYDVAVETEGGWGEKMGIGRFDAINPFNYLK